jgi:nitrate/nitrite transport system ATP-binding protein
MDEPFGALDALTRGTIQDQLLEICGRTQQTVFMITHDVDEALYLSDRVLLMSNGPAAQIAQSLEVTLPRPRDRVSLLRSLPYFELRSKVLEFLVGGHARAADAELTERSHSDAPTALAVSGEAIADTLT